MNWRVNFLPIIVTSRNYGMSGRIPKDDVIEDAIAKIKVKIHQYKKITPNLALVDEWVHT
jgi:hypothetical protein